MDEQGLTVAAVARRLGVATSTVRAWDRRYGLGPQGRDDSGRRLYAPADVARLDHMRRLVVDGQTAGRAAEAALAGEPPGPPSRPSEVAGPAPGSGGRVLALPGRGPDVRGLAAAAMAMDADACHRLVQAGLAARGVVPTWEQLVAPVLVAVGRRWEDVGDAIEVEHLLSEVVLGCLAVVARPSDPLPGQRPVLLVGAEGESHSLPLHALSAALREARVDVRLLGTGAPTVTVAAAVGRLGPAAVVVWAQTPTTGRPDLFEGLPKQRPPVTAFAAGPGWAGVTLPPAVRHLGSLGAAARDLAVVAGAQRPARTRRTTATTTSASAP